jgi:ubiquitin carboxyl-terminal hydrolase 34
MRGMLDLDNEAVLEERGNDHFYTASIRFARAVAMILLFNDDEVVRKLSATHFEELFVRHQVDENTPEDVLKLKYKAVRGLLIDLSDKIVLEYQRTTARSDIQPLAQVSEMLAGLITHLYESDDPFLRPCRHTQDGSIIEKYQTDAVPRLQNWPIDESTPVSTGGEWNHQPRTGIRTNVQQRLTIIRTMAVSLISILSSSTSKLEELR